MQRDWQKRMAVKREGKHVAPILLVEDYDDVRGMLKLLQEQALRLVCSYSAAWLLR